MLTKYNWFCLKRHSFESCMNKYPDKICLDMTTPGAFGSTDGCDIPSIKKHCPENCETFHDCAHLEAEPH